MPSSVAILISPNLQPADNSPPATVGGRICRKCHHRVGLEEGGCPCRCHDGGV